MAQPVAGVVILRRVRAAGAQVVPTAAEIWSRSDIVFKVRAPSPEEVALMREGGMLVGFVWPAQNPELMQQLLAIERRMGRLRSLKWGPRTIDLDLLHVEGESCSTAELALPHPGIAQRNFVLVPLAELDPDLEIPGVGPVAALSAPPASRRGRSSATSASWRRRPTSPTA